MLLVSPQSSRGFCDAYGTNTIIEQAVQDGYFLNNAVHVAVWANWPQVKAGFCSKLT